MMKKRKRVNSFHSIRYPKASWASEERRKNQVVWDCITVMNEKVAS
jgi:hypothetical protein